VGDGAAAASVAAVDAVDEDDFTPVVSTAWLVEVQDDAAAAMYGCAV
jgi:hypothetical protein